MKTFQDVPVEADTKIKHQKEVLIEKIPALHQKWVWDGIAAESIIFHNHEVENLTDEELFLMVKDYADSESKYTVKRADSGFTFINFNFCY